MHEQRVFGESSLDPCECCEGPFDYWGKSTGYRLFRCRTCGVVHSMKLSAPVPGHIRASRTLIGLQAAPSGLWTDSRGSKA